MVCGILPHGKVGITPTHFPAKRLGLGVVCGRASVERDSFASILGFGFGVDVTDPVGFGVGLLGISWIGAGRRVAPAMTSSRTGKAIRFMAGLAPLCKRALR